MRIFNVSLNVVNTFLPEYNGKIVRNFEFLDRLVTYLSSSSSAPHVRPVDKKHPSLQKVDPTGKGLRFTVLIRARYKTLQMGKHS